jgi:formylglycine-generating enzyme required for sulfatase activity
LYWSNGTYNGPSQPVVGVSWYEAVAFCNWRSAADGLTAAYDSAGCAVLGASGWRLPTEVEWEYAAAKGGNGQAERLWPWGDTWDSTKAVCSVSPASASAPANVGSKSTAGDTPQGLSDMAGNVWEWCSDNWQALVNVSTADRYYFVDDSSTTAFLLRGGAFSSSATSYLRCSERYGDLLNATVRNTTIGFRICRP